MSGVAALWRRLDQPGHDGARLIRHGDAWQLAGTALLPGFTPAANLIPIRRLGSGIGQEAQVTAAWLGFPSLTLEPLTQTYRRDGASTYHYVSAGGQFVAELQVNAAGFVTQYPGLWQLEASAAT